MNEWLEHAGKCISLTPFALCMGVFFRECVRLRISDTEGDTLIIYSNGTFVALAGNCEVEIVGLWQAPLGLGNVT